MLGAGTESNPYLVSTPQDLHDIRLKYTSYYQLTNDIDMSSWGNFIPIGKTSPFFKGHIDGDGYKIKNLTINDTSNQSGFISYLQSGSIKNLAIENGNVKSTGSNVGILVGYLHKSTGIGTIKNCYTTGTVEGNQSVGGLVGYIYSGSIEDSFSNANVTGFSYLGGLVGRSIANVPINNSYSTGKINSTNPDAIVGGLIGNHQTPDYVTNSYYDTQTSGQTISSGGIGKTTPEMKTQSTFTDWDFTTVWGINGDYPYLQVFGLPIAPAKKETVSVNSFVTHLDSQINNSKKSSKELHTHSNEFITASERHIATKRIVEGYLSNIETTATRNARTVKNTIAKVDTHIQPIESFINRESKKVNELLSYIQPIHSNVNVIYPILNKQITAYISVLFNDSSVFINEGMSSIQKVANTSESIINNNQSHSAMIINPSHVEVRK